MAKVKALKGFNDSASGKYVKRGATVDVEPARQKELARSGILPPVKSEDEPTKKQAEPPANKQAPDPGNKAITSKKIVTKEKIL